MTAKRRSPPNKHQSVKNRSPEKQLTSESEKTNQPDKPLSEKEKANWTLKPTTQAALTLWEYGNSNMQPVPMKLDFHGLTIALSEQTEMIINGDLKQCEAMLAAQVHTLDNLFNSLARLTLYNMDKPSETVDRILRLSLKAQSQCRATIETLSMIKNPPNPTFIRQANVAHNQQINNGAQVLHGSRARENKKQPNELLEDKDHGQRLDTTTTGTTSAVNPEMETVGAVNGAANK